MSTEPTRAALPASNPAFSTLHWRRRSLAVFLSVVVGTYSVAWWSMQQRSEPEVARASCAWFILICALGTVLGRRGSLALLDLVLLPIRRRPQRAVAALLLALFALTTFIALYVLDGFPSSADEQAYALQAETYARGRLWLDPPSPLMAFEQVRVIARNGRWLSIYQPGWALLLALPARIALYFAHAPEGALRPDWFVNPLLGTALAYALYRLAREQLSAEAAWLTVLGLCTSSFYLFNFASYFSHGVGALAGVLFALCGVRYQRTGEARWALLAGLCLGGLGFIRAANALVLAAPFALALALQKDRRIGLLWFGLGGLPFAALLLWYQKVITGSFLMPPQYWLLNGSEPLGVRSDFQGETPRRFIRLLMWTSPVILLAWPLSFFALLRRRELGFVHWIAPLTVLGFVFYGGHGGIQYGPRYYFECWPFVLLTVCSALAPWLPQRPPHDDAHAARAAHKLQWVFAALLCHLAFQVGYLPPRAAREHALIMEKQAPYREVAAAGLQNAVVLLRGDVGSMRPTDPRDLVRNRVELASAPVIYARDYTEEVTAELKARFPERHFYRFARGKLYEEADPRGLVPLSP
ncbi:MAG: hypothetical protein JWN48_1367 [Myxococcaceae bacterium]|nr:hypothetical protein [Myxococcaceae bacterium]